MKRFNSYLREMSMAAEMDLNFEFLKRAEKVTSFNLTEKDFQSSTYQREIRYLYTKNFFPNFDQNLFVQTPTKDGLNAAITAMRRESSVNFASIHNFRPGGTGPAEVLLYFLIDGAQLGGAASRGMDLFAAGKGYELKSVHVSTDGFIKDFKLGGTANLSGIINETIKLKREADPKATNKPGEINKTQQAKIARLFPNEWTSIQRKFRKEAADYFGQTNVIFTRSKSNKSQMGNVLGIGTVPERAIEIDMFTSGTIKPLIRVRDL